MDREVPLARDRDSRSQRGLTHARIPTLSRILRLYRVHRLSSPLPRASLLLVPLALLLAGGSPLPVLAAVLFLLLGSLTLRFMIVRLPHASA